MLKIVMIMLCCTAQEIAQELVNYAQNYAQNYPIAVNYHDKKANLM